MQLLLPDVRQAVLGLNCSCKDLLVRLPHRLRFILLKAHRHRRMRSRSISSSECATLRLLLILAVTFTAKAFTPPSASVAVRAVAAERASVVVRRASNQRCPPQSCLESSHTQHPPRATFDS